MRRSACASVKWNFKVGPGFVGCGFAAPVLTSIIVESSFEDQVVGIGEDLLVRVGLLAGRCECVGVFDLLVQDFDGLAWIKWLLELCVVVL